ncbi:Stk1 family PASTA domain-containing Ser/Thr kinase [Streptomyces uncialis]|uniref:Stk1 family PASTA domain-containing Ser/Thr kinase n=1 Tax=Streptomyces uncialis TaxID=1048205 RepID=UPI002E31C1A6|nr:Stk1 family PASTA domain-containing Ser/Thr kinase [Streptomyces uncialis]
MHTLQDPLVGQVLDARYRVDAHIATGGMATVYRALDTRLDRVVALKVMHPALAVDATFVERFIREAKSVARLSHPNVVGVFDQGAQGAYVYLAMEYVSGCTLRDVLRERGALQPRAALDILEPVLAALGAAHRAGFVHRDMKPENVLIGDDGRVKVADFGLVRAVDSGTGTTGTVLGTVAYLAPEQIEEGAADPRADVYACGVVLYEMLTGRKPHTGDTAAQVIFSHVNEDVPPPSAAVPGLSVELDDLVVSAAARTPAVRPHDAVALLAAVRAARSALTDEQLDAVPPQARTAAHDNADDRTSVIPRALGIPAPLPVNEPDDVQRTSVLTRAPAPARARTGRFGRFGGPPRSVLVAAGALLLTLLAGLGVWYINSGQFTKVPALLTRSETDARQRLTDAGLDVGDIRRQYSDTDRRGTVVATDPAAGERIRDNGSVGLTISLGPQTVRVPDVTDRTLAVAREEITSAGLEPGMVTDEFDTTVPKGEVISTEPAAGTGRRAGSAVAITVSRGAPVDVPDVRDQPLDEATAALEELGLRTEVAAERVTAKVPAGEVARQFPRARTEAAEGDTITLTLSKGPEMIEVPDVVGDRVDDARQTLEAAGFEVEEDRGILGIFGDTVRGQSVEAGEKAPEGSRIKLSIR